MDRKIDLELQRIQRVHGRADVARERQRPLENDEEIQIQIGSMIATSPGPEDDHFTQTISERVLQAGTNLIQRRG